MCRWSGVGLFGLRLPRAVIWLRRLGGLSRRTIARLCRWSGVGLFGLIRRRRRLRAGLRRLIGLAGAIRWLV